MSWSWAPEDLRDMGTLVIMSLWSRGSEGHQTTSLWSWVPEGCWDMAMMSPWSWAPEGHGDIKHHLTLDLGA